MWFARRILERELESEGALGDEDEPEIEGENEIKKEGNGEIKQEEGVKREDGAEGVKIKPEPVNNM